MKLSDFPTPPPLDFNPIAQCTWAEYSDTPPDFLRSVRRRGRRYLGIKYEGKAQTHLRDLYGDCYLPSQWIRYRALGDDRVRWCQPDGVLVDRASMALTIVEIKYNHTEVAWWQMFKLYLPVLEKLFDGYGYEFRCVEVCKWFDPAVRCPQKPRLRDRLEHVQRDEFAVHIWS